MESVKSVIEECRKHLDKDFDRPLYALSGELDVSEMVVRGGEVSTWSYMPCISSNRIYRPSPQLGTGLLISLFTHLMTRNI